MPTKWLGITMIIVGYARSLSQFYYLLLTEILVVLQLVE